MVASAEVRVNDTSTTATTSLPRFRFVEDAESKAFGPAEHIRAVHPANAQGTGLRRGFVVWWRPMKWRDDRGRDRNTKQWSTAIGSSTEDEAQTLISNGKQNTVNNLFFSMQAFRRVRGRKIDNLSALGCLFVDIDYKDLAQWKGPSGSHARDPCCARRRRISTTIVCNGFGKRHPSRLAPQLVAAEGDIALESSAGSSS
jgi:hypothetical protein